MRPTNYHLFDFLDFDPDLGRDESLWKACRPTAIAEEGGDIILTIPYQKQLLQNDMAADSAAPREAYTLRIRQYGDNIIRLYASFALGQQVATGSHCQGQGTAAPDSPQQSMTDSSEMLQMNPTLRHRPLTYRQDEGGWTLLTADDGRRRGYVNLADPILDRWSSLQPDPQETLDLTLYPDGKRPVRLSAYDHFSPPRYDALPLAFCKRDGQPGRATFSVECQPNECFTGTGERFAKMDLSGHTFFLKNQDGQGVNSPRTYKNIPFYLSSRLYGIFYHTSAYCKLSLAHASTRSVQYLCDQPEIDAFVIAGHTPEEVLRGYRDLTGYPTMPPLWSLGTWMSRMTYFSADEVNEICDRLRREHYPCDVIHLDTGWFRTDWLCEWAFNPERFPDPEGFIHHLKDNGFRVSLWQLPYVAEDAEQIDEARANDYIGPLRHRQASEGSNFSALDYAGTIDFTYPAATAWYQGLLRRLLRMGVVCIKTDFGENIHMDATYKGMRPGLLNNLYALLYQKAAYEVTREVTGDGIIWARAAWAGCQRYPLHWGGDCCSSWDGMAGSLRGGLHLGLSGFAFWSHDVPGFHTLPNFMNSIVQDDVYVRWTQFGVFTSHIRYHGTNKREPWHYPAIAPIVKQWWKLRYRLIPYLLEQSRKATETGYPVLRALLMHHPDDRTCWHIDDEYYFGDDFLVAPVMNSEGRRDVYLPQGQWVNFFTGERLEGPRWLHDLEVPLEEMPVYLRPGTVIPIYEPEVDCTDQMDLSQTTMLHIDDKFHGIWH